MYLRGVCMNKLLSSFLILIALCFIILAFWFIFSHRKNPKELKLTYKISAGIPFRWEYEIEDESVVKFVKSYVIKDENKGGKVGAPIYTNYVFKGLKQGSTTIVFKYVNFTEGRVSSEKRHKVVVDHDLNVYLAEE